MDHSTETSFVYYLLSNASMNVYKDNKPQHFRTLLPTPLYLEGEWEVGLSTIIYPHNWNQLKSQGTLMVNLPVTSNASGLRINEAIRIEFSFKQFDSLTEFVKVLNEHLNAEVEKHILTSKTVFKPVTLEEKHTYKHLQFSLSSGRPQKLSLLDYGYGTDFKIDFPRPELPTRELWRMCGFEDKVTEIVEGSQAKNPVSLTLQLPSLFVYTPMIEYVGVGDTHAPLFAVVPVRGNLGDIVYERFDKPIYMRLNQKYIAEIEVSIKDDTGEDIVFNAGKTILILHFRRRT